MEGDTSMSSSHQYRKVMKPLLERKRRARINSCLEELKELMESTGGGGEAMQRLEKADVLEVTVRHLRDLKARGRLAAGADITSTSTFRSGFSACAREVSSFITSPESGVEQQQALHIALGVADGLRRLQDPTIEDRENLRPQGLPARPQHPFALSNQQTSPPCQPAFAPNQPTSALLRPTPSPFQPSGAPFQPSGAPLQPSLLSVEPRQPPSSVRDTAAPLDLSRK